jgi:hypothetical protein
VKEEQVSALPRRQAGSALASRDDLRRVLRDLDDATALEVLALSPTVAELEQAAVRAAGEGSGLDRTGHPLTGTVAAIVAILAREDEPDR